MVYILDINGKPLMPTTRHAKVRKMLANKQAKVVKECPFTIQLTYSTTSETQPISLGIDAGSKHIGVSATTEDKVLYEADITLRNDIVDLLSSRREMRHTRRNRKTRYRQARFNNRKRCDKWLAPSVVNKIETHLTAVNNVHKILPVSKITVETASFDIQKIKNPDISGEEYQQGEQLGFWNIREYVLFRDGHKCQCCKGKSKDPILNVHHIESRKVGGDAPNNLITLCETCHKGYHKGTIKLPKTIKRGMKFNDATFMGVMRWAFYSELKETYSDVHMTFGYITKNTRIENGLPKDHYIDARCISGNPLAKPSDIVYYKKKIRCHNRQIHKMTIQKGGTRRIVSLPHNIHGFVCFDEIKLNGNTYYVASRRSSGYFLVKTLLGEKPNKSGNTSYKNLKFIRHQQGYITEKVKYVKQA